MLAFDTAAENDFVIPQGLQANTPVTSLQQLSEQYRQGPFHYRVLGETPGARMTCLDEGSLADVEGLFTRGEKIVLDPYHKPWSPPPRGPNRR
ncbi:MAG: hypothetical protein JWM46_905 [Candidatus Kaiserbacteria bacterium]|nr:hypothetical protein [Candidatus Kaiserbacteria bacterium]